MTFISKLQNAVFEHTEHATTITFQDKRKLTVFRAAVSEKLNKQVPGQQAWRAKVETFRGVEPATPGANTN